MTSTQLRPSNRPDATRRPLDPLARLRRRWATVVAATVVVVLFAIWLVWYSPVLAVRSVDVHGERTLQAAAVERAGGVRLGQPLVRVDTSAIAKRVEALPQIESARVSTSYPSTVVITVTERTPVGYVVRGGRQVLVDRSGKQYLGVTATPDLPKFVVPSGADRRATGAAIATVAAALPTALRVRTKSIEALDPGSITVVLAGKGSDLLVRWGSAARSALKATIVGVLRARKQVELIDVSDPQRPFTR